MRTRLTDSTLRTWYTRQDSYDGVLDPLVYYTNGKTNLGTYKIIKDTTVPRYLKRVKDGEIIMNSCYIRTSTYNSSSGSFTVGPHPGWGTRTWSGYLVSAAAPDSPVLDDYWVTDEGYAFADAVNKAFAAAYTSSSTAIVSVGEFKETLAMLRRPMSGAIAKINKMIKRRRSLLSRGLNLTEASTQVWLEYRMGWKPLLYDLSNICKAFDKVRAAEKPERLVFRGSAFRDYSKSGVHTSTILSNSTKVEYVTSLKLKANAGVIVQIANNSAYHSISKAFGFHLSDVPSAMWELTTLSFVVDRFINIGDWIQANVPTPGMDVLGSWCTVTKETEFVCNGQSTSTTVYTGTPKTYDTPLPGSHRENHKEMTRSTGVTPSVLPPLTVGELSIVQHMDHISLIVGHLLSFVKRK